LEDLSSNFFAFSTGLCISMYLVLTGQKSGYVVIWFWHLLDVDSNLFLLELCMKTMKRNCDLRIEGLICFIC